MTSSAFHLFTNTRKPLPGYEQYANIGFRFQDRVVNFWNSLFTPLFTPDFLPSILFIIIILLGVVVLIKEIVHAKKIKKQEKEYFFILLAPIIIFGMYVFYPYPLWPHYLLPISVFAIFVLVFSIHNIWEKHLYIKIFVCVFLFFSLISPLFWLKDNYVTASPYVSTSEGTYKNQLTVANWVINDTKNKEYGYFVYTPGILTYNMDYLLWWISSKNHFATPSNLKHPITYLIMYPHESHDNNAYNFWKKNVVRTNGKVIFTKNFAGGITVEKLQISHNEQPADPNYYQDLIFR